MRIENASMKFDDNKVIGTIQVPIDIKEQDLFYVLDGCFAGGSAYWAGLDNSGEQWDAMPKGLAQSEWATKILLDGGSIKFYDVEEGEDDSNWVLTKDKFMVGIQKYLKERPDMQDFERWDAGTDDSILQFALFGEEVFG